MLKRTAERKFKALAAKKPIQEDIQTHIASMKEKLAKYKNDSDYKEILDSFDKFVTVNESFIKNNGVGAIKVQSAVAGPPTDMIELDTAKSNLVLAFNKIIDNQVDKAQQTYEQSKSVYSETLVGLISLIIICTNFIKLLRMYLFLLI